MHDARQGLAEYFAYIICRRKGSGIGYKTPMPVDIAINYDDAVARQRGRVRDSGDLGDAISIDTVNASGLFLHPSAAALQSTPAGAMLRLGAVAEFELRRGPSVSSELVRRIGGGSQR